MSDTFIFGYGSLLDQEDAERTVPDIEYLYNARLPGYRITCTRFSNGRGGGVADVVPYDTSDVWGAVYQVSAAGLEALDRREGIRALVYCRDCMTVLRNGDENDPVRVEVYTVVDKSAEPVPCTREYRDLILRGAESRRLPEEYIRLLRTIPVK